MNLNILFRPAVSKGASWSELEIPDNKKEHTPCLISRAQIHITWKFKLSLLKSEEKNMNYFCPEFIWYDFFYPGTGSLWQTAVSECLAHWHQHRIFKQKYEKKISHLRIPSTLGLFMVSSANSWCCNLMVFSTLSMPSRTTSFCFALFSFNPIHFFFYYLLTFLPYS